MSRWTWRRMAHDGRLAPDDRARRSPRYSLSCERHKATRSCRSSCQIGNGRYHSRTVAQQRHSRTTNRHRQCRHDIDNLFVARHAYRLSRRTFPSLKFASRIKKEYAFVNTAIKSSASPAFRRQSVCGRSRAVGIRRGEPHVQAPCAAVRSSDTSA